jgi:hypothetical protein
LIGEVTGESVVFPNDESREFLFVLNAILDEVFELGAILGLGAFTALDKDFDNLEALIDGELAAFLLLAFEAISFFSLFFG